MILEGSASDCIQSEYNTALSIILLDTAEFCTEPSRGMILQNTPHDARCHTPFSTESTAHRTDTAHRPAGLLAQ